MHRRGLFGMSGPDQARAGHVPDGTSVTVQPLPVVAATTGGHRRRPARWTFGRSWAALPSCATTDLLSGSAVTLSIPASSIPRRCLVGVIRMRLVAGCPVRPGQTFHVKQELTSATERRDDAGCRRDGPRHAVGERSLAAPFHVKRWGPWPAGRRLGLSWLRRRGITAAGKIEPLGDIEPCWARCPKNDRHIQRSSRRPSPPCRRYIPSFSGQGDQSASRLFAKSMSEGVPTRTGEHAQRALCRGLAPKLLTSAH